MVGGRLPDTKSKNINELIYRFEFPEKPGALMTFLNSMKPEWTISIFHYRNHGSDIGRIVVGVLVLKDDMKAWNLFLKEIGYNFVDESINPSYKLFLGA